MSTRKTINNGWGDKIHLAGSVDGAGNFALNTAAPNLTVKGYQQITSLAASTALTVPSGARLALITCETQNVRWRDDGTNPTASIGQLLTTGVGLFYDGDLAAIRFIEVTASAKLNVCYYA